MPACIYCPDPRYSDEARRAKLSWTSVLNVIVSAKGEVLAVGPLRLLGAGLDEEASKTVKTWRLKSAVDAQGHPVSTFILLEITYRLF